MNDDIARHIARFVEPNPVVYFKLACVCRAFYSAFMGESCWRLLDLYGVKTGISDHFKTVCTGEDREKVRDYWRSAPDCGSASDNLYVQLAIIVFNWENVSNIEWIRPFLESERLMYCAVNIDGNAIRFASEELRHQRKLAMMAVRKGSSALKYLGNFCNDREVVLCAVQTYGLTLKYASGIMQADRDIVMAAVNDYGCSLQYASLELRGDRKIVQSAVREQGLALQYASLELRGDRKIVQIAVRENGLALQDASEKLRGDWEIVQRAVQEYGPALQYASKELRCDQELRQRVGKYDCGILGSNLFLVPFSAFLVCVITVIVAKHAT